jgi:serine/threonine protein kinase
MSEQISSPGHLLEGKYEIVGVVGEGAWGQVLEGINIRIRRKVAIKILKAEYASNGDMVRRFEREALASTHIESPHVVQIFDAGVLVDGRPYLVMEFLTGEDLSTHITKVGKLNLVAAVELCAQVARGLAAAHAAGVFHRDMKPSNIVIAKTKSGREIAKIVDFGISKLLDVTKASVSHTQTGTVLGSPVYMSPEQARGSKSTDHRSDIYSLGVVLFECLTGTTPHTADGFNELLFKIVLEAAPSVRSLRPEVDEELDEIVRLSLAKTPEQRIQTATELEGLLVGWLAKRDVKLSDSPVETGDRQLPVLTSSPVIGARPISSGKLVPAREVPADNLHATVPVASGTEPVSEPSLTRLVDGDVQIAPSSPSGAVAGAVSTGPSVKSTLLDSAMTRPKPMGSRSRLGYFVGGGLVLAVVAGAAIAARPHAVPTPMSSATPIDALPTKGIPTAPAPGTATTLGVAPSSATLTSAASANPAMSSGREAPRTTPSAAVAGPGLVGVGTGKPKPAVSARPTADPQPVASSASSASVGGRTIRTDL